MTRARTETDIRLNRQPSGETSPAATDAAGIQRDLAATSARLAKEVAFRVKLCGEAVAAVLDKYDCIATARDGAVQITSRK